jgi:hypothetical protein
MQVSEEQAAVQVMSHPFGQVIIDARFWSVLEAGKPLAHKMADMHFNMLPRHTQTQLAPPPTALSDQAMAGTALRCPSRVLLAEHAPPRALHL